MKKGEWINFKADGSIETCYGTIPNKLREAANLYASYRVECQKCADCGGDINHSFCPSRDESYG